MMRRPNVHRISNYLIALWWLTVLVTSGAGQTKPAQPTEAQDEVIRVNTELVQTDVMVFDKQGRFVDGLKPEQFELKIDHKPQQIAFFERVASGRLSEAKPANSSSPSDGSATGPPIVNRSRAVIFFVDDLHLAPDSLVRTRKALLEFIDRGMTENDQVAVTSSSGQIGFLQQLTDNKIALRSAVARLNYRANTTLATDEAPMSEYIALKIREGDESTISYYVSEILKQNSYRAGPNWVMMVSPQAARHLVIEPTTP
jgi:VWFA-related protein